MFIIYTVYLLTTPSNYYHYFYYYYYYFYYYFYPLAYIRLTYYTASSMFIIITVYLLNINIKKPVSFAARVYAHSSLY